MNKKQISRYLLVFIFTLSTSAVVAQKKNVIEHVTFEIIKNLHEDAILLDVRTPSEVDRGSIPGATAVDFLQLELFKIHVEQFNKSTPVYLFCHSGGRSYQAALILKQMGFKKIYDYTGGYADWALRTQ